MEYLLQMFLWLPITFKFQLKTSFGEHSLTNPCRLPCSGAWQFRNSVDIEVSIRRLAYHWPRRKTLDVERQHDGMKRASRRTPWSAPGTQGDSANFMDSVHTKAGARNMPTRKQGELSKGSSVPWALSSPLDAPLNHWSGEHAVPTGVPKAFDS